jgi:hypothetical protein
LVLTRLRQFLMDKAQIAILLRDTRCRPAEMGRALGIADDLASSLKSASQLAHRAVVTDCLARVTVSPEILRIDIARDRLVANLTEKPIGPSKAVSRGELIAFEVRVPSMSRDGSGKLVVEDQGIDKPDATVVKAIARATNWFEQLTSGKCQSMAQIALHENITDNYISNLIHLAWLSPKLIEQVLQADLKATQSAKIAMINRKIQSSWNRQLSEPPLAGRASNSSG